MSNLQFIVLFTIIDLVFKKMNFPLHNATALKRKGLLRELNPGPLAPEARITPLDQAANET